MMVHLSASTHALLQQSGEPWHFVSRNPISVKGKGVMQTYFLGGIKGSGADGRDGDGDISAELARDVEQLMHAGFAGSSGTLYEEESTSSDMAFSRRPSGVRGSACRRMRVSAGLV